MFVQPQIKLMWNNFLLKLTCVLRCKNEMQIVSLDWFLKIYEFEGKKVILITEQLFFETVERYRNDSEKTLRKDNFKVLLVPLQTETLSVCQGLSTNWRISYS